MTYMSRDSAVPSYRHSTSCIAVFHHGHRVRHNWARVRKLVCHSHGRDLCLEVPPWVRRRLRVPVCVDGVDKSGIEGHGCMTVSRVMGVWLRIR